MKLKELLVQELPKRGGWPEGAEIICSHGNGHVYAYATKCRTSGRQLPIYGGSGQAVTREQYESALAAAQPQWDRNYPIKAGTDVEVHFEGDDSRVWTEFRVEYMRGDVVVLHDYRSDDVNAYSNKKLNFRPIRSEADKKRDEIERAIANALFNDGDFDSAEALRLATFIYGAMSRNEIPHVHIE
ncbi:hypothetical protein [Enterobacter sp.]|uniref:hypothetical protein n=1 Tax=Enterobacter sp. TaxID=42895 RepID=UPI00296F5EC2|nr:hypothetical protein [Enterobacter sp.]